MLSSDEKEKVEFEGGEANKNYNCDWEKRKEDQIFPYDEKKSELNRKFILKIIDTTSALLVDG